MDLNGVDNRAFEAGTIAMVVNSSLIFVIVQGSIMDDAKE